jgi:hypothetical protein
MYMHFFPQVKALTENMQLISELAEFSNEDLSDFHMMEDTMGNQGTPPNRRDTATDPVNTISSLGQFNDDTLVPYSSMSPTEIISGRTSLLNTSDFGESDSESSTEAPDQLKIFPTSSSRSIGFSLKKHHVTAFYEVKNKLDRWKEPMHIGDMVSFHVYHSGHNMCNSLLFDDNTRMIHPFKIYFFFVKRFRPWTILIHLRPPLA